MASAVAVVDYRVEGAQVAVGSILNKAEEARLVDVIRKMELGTTGEIRIHITKSVSKNGIMADAAATFEKLGMTKTRQRNGVLLYIAVKAHELAVIGDEGIHKIVGQEGWQHIVDDLRAYFAKGDYYAGLHKAIEGIGAVLTAHFPGTGSPNELPDQISSH